MKIRQLLLLFLLFSCMGEMRAERGLLLKPSCTASEFGTMKTHSFTQKKSGNLFRDLGFGFVFANTTSLTSFKDNAFYKKAVETGSPYTSQYAVVSNYLHFELHTPIINIMYENTLPVWSTFPSSPRFSRTHFDFLSVSTLGGSPDVIRMTLAMILPHVTHDVMSTRDYSKDIWDINFLFLVDYRVTTETFLQEHHPYRIKYKRIYYLGMTKYEQILLDFSRFIQIASIRDGYDYEGVVILPVLPFFDFYSEKQSRENLVNGNWEATGEESGSYNFDVGIMWAHDYQLGHKILLQPYFKWTLYSTNYVKTPQGDMPMSGIDASISIQYIF